MLGGSKKSKRTYEDPDDFRAPLADHLEELRTRIIRIITLLAVGWVVGWFLQPPLYGFLDKMIRDAILPVIKDPSRYQDAFRNATEPFLLTFRLSFLIGVILTFPFIVLQLWGFIEPGLKPSERKPFRRLAPVSLLLFAMGAGFCWIILPSALGWFATFLNNFNAALFQEPGAMVFFVLKMMLAFGVGFQLPLVVFILGSLGLLSAETLVKYWRQAATMIFLGSAILTPSNDAFSMLMMAVPLSILFMISVWAVKIVQRKRPKKVDEYAVDED